jgi:hypothetical protein
MDAMCFVFNRDTISQAGRLGPDQFLIFNYRFMGDDPKGGQLCGPSCRSVLPDAEASAINCEAPSRGSIILIIFAVTRKNIH